MLAEWMGRLGRREKAGLLLVGIAVILVVLDRLVVLPLAQRCEWLDRDIALEQNRQELFNGWLRIGPDAEQKFAAIRQRIGDPLPAAETIDKLKGDIDALARGSDVVLLSVKHREPRHAEFYDEYAVDCEFDTDEIGLIRCLHALMSAPGTFRVTRLKIVPTDNTARRIKGSMTITKVAMPQPSTAAEAESPAGGGA